jgi:hypothetical protein
MKKMIFGLLMTVLVMTASFASGSLSKAALIQKNQFTAVYLPDANAVLSDQPQSQTTFVEGIRQPGFVSTLVVNNKSGKNQIMLGIDAAVEESSQPGIVGASVTVNVNLANNRSNKANNTKVLPANISNSNQHLQLQAVANLKDKESAKTNDVQNQDLNNANDTQVANSTQDIKIVQLN